MTAILFSGVIFYQHRQPSALTNPSTPLRTPIYHVTLYLSFCLARAPSSPVPAPLEPLSPSLTPEPLATYELYALRAPTHATLFSLPTPPPPILPSSLPPSLPPRSPSSLATRSPPPPPPLPVRPISPPYRCSITFAMHFFSFLFFHKAGL